MSEPFHSREYSLCPIFGAPSELATTCLPSYNDVMKNYNAIRLNLKTSDQEPQVSKIVDILSRNIERVWTSASIPTVENLRIMQKIKHYHSKCRTLLKSFKTRQNTESFKIKLQIFRNESEKLFDISACKCKVMKNCECKLNKKVPLIEQKFLTDQRTTRKMMIHKCDVNATRKLKARTARRAERNQQYESRPSTSKCKSTETLVSSSSDTENEITDSDYEPDPRSIMSIKKQKSHDYNVNKTTELAIACDRTGVSDRTAAVIASAVLSDMGIIHEEDLHLVIDKNKVRRSRKRERSNMGTNDQKVQLESIYFDGRKDRTLTHEVTENLKRVITVTEEHVVMIQEPGHDYIGHVTPVSGSAQSISSSMLTFLHDKGIDISLVKAIGCDGTVVNTGSKGGAIKCIEEHLKREVQWFICLLHANELPLRHIVHEIDGKTTGPQGFSGPIGKELINCENKPIVKYQRIEAVHIDVDIEDLGTDQMYLAKIYNAIREGECSSSLAQQNPGKMGHARWLTTANRILRLYVSSEEPSDNFKCIVEYIMKIYVPCWFEIKKHSSAAQGSKHLYQMVKLSRSLSLPSRRIIEKVLQRNCFFAHQENILLCMIYDEEKHIRQLGWRRILKARDAPPRKATVRQFTLPKLKFDAEVYHAMIDWQQSEPLEPPLTKHFSREDILEKISTGEAPESIQNFPCHTQAVERHIKLVTEASAAVCGSEGRDGFIRTRLYSRNKMPKIESKGDFCI